MGASAGAEMLPYYDCVHMARTPGNQNWSAVGCGLDIGVVGWVDEIATVGQKVWRWFRGAPNSRVDEIIGALCSFSGETEVLLMDGTTKPISEIAIGEWVQAEDPETGERGPREVTHLWVHQDTIVDLKIAGHDVATTEDHPFWNHTDGEWQRADALDPGDLVLTAEGATVTVYGMDWGSARTTTAYNLTVDDIHTYFVEVGGEPVLVHNTCPFTDGAWVSVDDALDAGQRFVGSGADELGPGVFRSASPNSDGSYNVFRMTDSDLSTSQAPSPHVNFEVHTPNARGGFDITENIHVFLTDFP